MAKLSLTPIGSAYGSIDALNRNFDAIEVALENTLSRDGTTPNAMGADLDMNSKSILNAASVSTQGLILGGVQVSLNSSFKAAGFTEPPVVTTANGQTVISVAPTVLAPSSMVLVFVNGLKLPRNSYSFSGSSVTVPALQASDEVEIVEIKVA
jgi:hypothetical protein